MAGDLNGAKNRARVGGSGFTVFTWDDKPVLFARQISHQSAAPVGPGVVPIHPMDEPYPVEIITPLAASMGTLTLELYELYGAMVWERLASYFANDVSEATASEVAAGGSAVSGGHGPVDIVGVFNAVANTDRPVRLVKYIKPPKIRGKVMRPYTEEYHNCVVSNVNNSETIEIGTMEVLKQMTVNYTHITRNKRNPMLSNRSKNLKGVNLSDTPGTAFS